jgi:hypothetical protein
VPRYSLRLIVLLLSLVCLPQLATAQSLNLEGQTGGVITPFAIVPDGQGLNPVVSFQSIFPGDTVGTRFLITLGADAGGRGEFGYTRAAIATGDVGDVGQLFDRGFHGVHGKLLLLREDTTPGVPAIAVGGRVRWNGEELHLANPMRNGDVFVVATKSFDVAEGASILVNGGVKLTNASLFGFAGTAEDWTARGFGAVAVTMADGRVSAGAEILQQPKAFEGLPEAEVPATVSVYAKFSPVPERLSINVAFVRLAGELATNPPTLPWLDVVDADATAGILVGATVRF